MITMNIFFVFLGSYLLYGTSQRAILHTKSVINTWITTHKKVSKIVGFACFVLGLIVSVFYFNVTAGILFWLFVVTSILGLIIILTPLQKITYKHSFILFVITLTIEFIS